MCEVGTIRKWIGGEGRRSLGAAWKSSQDRCYAAFRPNIAARIGKVEHVQVDGDLVRRQPLGGPISD